MLLTTDFVTDFTASIASDEGVTVPATFDAQELINSVYAVKFVFGRGWSHLSNEERDQARIEHIGHNLLVEVYRLLGI